jgi:hypothetical protein
MTVGGKKGSGSGVGIRGQKLERAEKKDEREH